MTPDQIERMAREAGLLLGGHMCGRCNEYAWPDEEAFRFAQAVRAAALEEVKYLCEERADEFFPSGEGRWALKNFADEISSLIHESPTTNQGTPE